jgi:hypothetical protein
MNKSDYMKINTLYIEGEVAGYGYKQRWKF